eukprot:2794103-Rhodomonas_salina.2
MGLKPDDHGTVRLVLLRARQAMCGADILCCGYGTRHSHAVPWLSDRASQRADQLPEVVVKEFDNCQDSCDVSSENWVTVAKEIQVRSTQLRNQSAPYQSVPRTWFSSLISRWRWLDVSEVCGARGVCVWCCVIVMEHSIVVEGSFYWRRVWCCAICLRVWSAMSGTMHTVMPGTDAAYGGTRSTT